MSNKKAWGLFWVVYGLTLIGIFLLCSCGGESRYNLSTPGQVCFRDLKAPSILIRVDGRGDPHGLIEVPCPVSDQVNVRIPGPDAGVSLSKDGGTRHGGQDGGDCSHGDDDDKTKCPCDDDRPCDD